MAEIKYTLDGFTLVTGSGLSVLIADFVGRAVCVSEVARGRTISELDTNLVSGGCDVRNDEEGQSNTDVVLVDDCSEVKEGSDGDGRNDTDADKASEDDNIDTDSEDDATSPDAGVKVDGTNDSDVNNAFEDVDDVTSTTDIEDVVDNAGDGITSKDDEPNQGPTVLDVAGQLLGVFITLSRLSEKTPINKIITKVS